MIIATETAGGWENPTAGLHQAVCIDVIDLGTQPTQWGDKEKLKLMFQLEETKEDGSPLTIGRNYTRSLHEKAALRKDLKSWRASGKFAADADCRTKNTPALTRRNSLARRRR